MNAGKSKLKLAIAAACGLALLLGVGIGLRYSLPAKPGKAAPKTKQVKAADKSKPAPAAKSPAKPAPTTKPTAGKAKPAVTWQALESQFKPEGDAQQQTRQRIAFLKQLIRRFPKDQANILNANLTIAAQAEILGDSRQAAEFYTRFLDQSPTNDSRRLGAAIPLIKNLAAAGHLEQAGKIFDQF